PPLRVVAVRGYVVVAGICLPDLVRAANCLHCGHSHYPGVRVSTHRQQNQPPGVPPLALTGERTLPDVPAENYWFQRHLAVYEWIGARVIGLRVIDMACGEGYGSEVLSRSAESVHGVD